ncbi:MAG: TonB-dependent receptor, partial [Chitinophagaceae bacterium]|nr:TonB-dependent receptor [Chitinophagaceae bacterium]
LTEGRGFSVSGQPSDQLIRNMASGSSFTPNALDLSKYRYNAFFGRIGYTYKEKYLLSLTGRRDGSSRFGVNNQFENFGSIGLGWILSGEPFLKNTLPFISFAKIRGSYGTTGNDQLGNYRFMSLYQSVVPSILYQDQPGLGPTNLPNPNLEWESNKKLQAGIDLGFVNDRFLLTVNYIRNRVSNSLTDITLPIIAGFLSFNDNLAALFENTGWEFSLRTDLLKSSAVKWNASVNLTIPRNKLLAFPDLATSSFKDLFVIGKSRNITREYVFSGVDPQTGTYFVTDRHGNPTNNPTPEDLYLPHRLGTQWYGGMQNSLSYGGFQLDFFIQYTNQVSRLPLEFGFPGRLVTSSTTSGNQPASVMQRWQKPGDVTNYQRFSSTPALGLLEQGDRNIGD